LSLIDLEAMSGSSGNLTGIGGPDLRSSRTKRIRLFKRATGFGLI
jgi:hypothetical protein